MGGGDGNGGPVKGWGHVEYGHGWVDALCISGSGCFGMGVTIRGTTGHGQNTGGCPLLGMATWLHLVPGPNLRFRYLDESRALLSILADSKFALLLNRHRSFVCVLGDSESEAKMWALWTTSTVWPRYQEWWVQFSTCSATMPAKRNRQSVIVFWDQKLKSDHHVYLCLPSPSRAPARHRGIVQTSMSGAWQHQLEANADRRQESNDCERHLSLPRGRRDTGHVAPADLGSRFLLSGTPAKGLGCSGRRV